MALPPGHISSPSPASLDIDTQAHYTRSHNGPLDELNLSYFSTTAEATIQSCTTETLSRNILCEMQLDRTGRTERYKIVTFSVDDPENPKNWDKLFKWWCTMVVAITCFAVAFNSAVITADIGGVAKTFHISEEVALLSISLFVMGFGIGPMVYPPMKP